MLGDEKGGVQTITIEGIDIFHLVVQSCNVSCRAQMIKHPVENGTGVFDDKVLEPRVITIRALVGAADGSTKRALRLIWRNRQYMFYTITTREAVYRNFSCEECSHEEGSEKLDALDYTIRFCEIIKATTRPKPGSIDDANVENFGKIGS